MNDVVISPFSNSYIRDWPIGHFAELAGLLLQRLPDDTIIRITGSHGQRLRAREIVRPHPSNRVINDCGKLAWPELLTLMRQARCVISNNSGIGHLGGYMGVPTVCVFSGSHQRHEWRPRGRNVILVSRVIGCSPCQLDHGGESTYAKACLREIDPKVVADATLAAMERGALHLEQVRS